MIVLGIESTAHTFGAGIVDKKCNILANEKASFTTKEGGIKPTDAADHHIEKASKVIETALQKAGRSIKEIDAISFSQGPGLGPCLKAGAVAARTLSLKHNKPLLGVNHCIAHIEIGKKACNARDPLVVYASGGNTQVIGFKAGKYRVYGETIDIGIGNLQDSFGRAIGLGFPAGPKLDELYLKGKNLIKLPYSVKGMDLTFAGLLTAAENKIGKIEEADLVFSLLHTAFAMLCEVSERALVHAEKKEVLLTGGVAASKPLQEMLEKMCKGQKARFFVTPRDLAVDNGAMIAWQGLIEFKARKKGIKLNNSKVIQRYRTDAVKVDWL